MEVPMVELWVKGKHSTPPTKTPYALAAPRHAIARDHNCTPQSPPGGRGARDSNYIKTMPGCWFVHFPSECSDLCARTSGCTSFSVVGDGGSGLQCRLISGTDYPYNHLYGDG